MPFALGPAESAAMRRAAAAEIVAMVAGKPVTRAQLVNAFEYVENRDHWKNPICRHVSADMLARVGGEEMISAAVAFFHGEHPAIAHTEGGGVLVQSRGYYAVVGA